MKQPYNALIGMAAVLMFVCSCSSDSDSVKSVNPLETYLKKAGFTNVDEMVDGGDYEFGISFIPQTDGKITDVIVRIPDDRTDLRVTIWDVATETVLHTEIIANVTVGAKVTQSITPLALTEGTEYMITFNSNDWYDYDEPNGTPAVYPISVGSIDITGYGYYDGSDQVLPNSFQDDYYAGDLSFKFVSK